MRDEKTVGFDGATAPDGGKLVKGRKRHIAVDTQGLLCPTALMAVWVSPADVGDRDGARETLSYCYGTYPRLSLVWADGGYSGPLAEEVAAYGADVVEQATLDAVRAAWQRPEAIAEALAVYSDPDQAADAGASGDVLSGIEAALSSLDAEQRSVVQAQIAGVRAGAPADAYAEAFADIAARRRDLEARRRRLKAEANPRKPGKADPSAATRAMEEAWRVLSDENVPGVEKRDLLGTIVRRVVCRKDGADVVFHPGVFATPGRESDGDLSLYTTCIGISTQR